MCVAGNQLPQNGHEIVECSSVKKMSPIHLMVARRRAAVFLPKTQMTYIYQPVLRSTDEVKLHRQAVTGRRVGTGASHTCRRPLGYIRRQEGRRRLGLNKYPQCFAAVRNGPRGGGAAKNDGRWQFEAVLEEQPAQLESNMPSHAVAVKCRLGKFCPLQIRESLRCHALDGFRFSSAAFEWNSDNRYRGVEAGSPGAELPLRTSGMMETVEGCSGHVASMRPRCRSIQRLLILL